MPNFGHLRWLIQFATPKSTNKYQRIKAFYFASVVIAFLPLVWTFSSLHTYIHTYFIATKEIKGFFSYKLSKKYKEQ